MMIEKAKVNLFFDIQLMSDKEDLYEDVAIDMKEFNSFNELTNLLSKKLDVKITPMKFFIQMLYNNDWVNIIDLKSFYFFLSNNVLNNEKSKMLIKRKHKTIHVEYNLDGEIFEGISLNRPNMKMYPIDSKEVFCVFCQESSKNEYIRTKVGPIYGPVKEAQKLHYFHEICVIWAPNVFISNDDGKFKNVSKEIKNCRKYKCSLCNQKGSSLYCYIKTCKNFYHYICAITENCHLNWFTYNMHCKNHIDSAISEQNEIDQDATQQNSHDDNEDNFNNNQKVCYVCKSDDNENMLLCEKCENYIHSNCNETDVQGLPEVFVCYKCELSN